MASFPAFSQRRKQDVVNEAGAQHYFKRGFIPSSENDRASSKSRKQQIT